MEKEAIHLIEVLQSTLDAIKEHDADKLKELSNQTIHNASIYQDTGNLSVAVLVYAISKIVERKDYEKIEKWPAFLKKIDALFNLAISSLEEENFNAYENYLEKARESINVFEADIRPYIDEVMRKASINKGSKIYEHGISLGQAAHILGITEWELSEYAGQKVIPDSRLNITLNVQKRAKMAMEFFS